jgi:hypothetical protein
MGVSYVPLYMDNMRVIIDINKKRGDYLAFKPAAELEIIRNQLTLRAGYSFSWRDIQAFKDLLGGNGDDNYYKSNMVGLCLGIGLCSEIAERKVAIDAAFEFLTIPLPPSLVISARTNL